MPLNHPDTKRRTTRPFQIAVVATFVILVGAVASAQTTDDGRGYVAFKAGLNAEQAEDNLRGNTPGAGLVLGIGRARTWMPEVEFWYPGWIRTDRTDGRHRDILGSLAFRRTFSSGRARPYLLLGFSVARTDTQFRTCAALRHPPGSTVAVPTIVSCSEPDVVERERERFSSTGFYALGGGGVEIALGRKLRLLPDVRVDFAITSVIVRPSIGIGFVF